MFNLNNSLIKNTFINTVIFFFIVLVFLNQIHLQLDNFIFEKTNVENHFLKKDSDYAKKKFSESLIDERNYIALDRDCVVSGYFGDRHKVRWVKAVLLKNFFSLSKEINEKLPYYNNILLHSLLVFLSLLILKKTFNLKEKYILFFLLYFTFIFQNFLSEYSYSIFEMFFLSLSLYASKKKKFLIFLTSTLLAVLNRESGFIIILTWLVFNNEYKKLILGSVLIGLIFIFINFDIIKCIFRPEFFIPLENQDGHTDLHDLSKIDFISLSKLLILNFFLPFGLPFYYLFVTQKKNISLIGIFFIYLITFIIATPLHHVSVRLLLLPLILTSMYLYHSEKKTLPNLT